MQRVRESLIVVIGPCYEGKMHQLHSSQMSSGAADVLRNVVTPTPDGMWDLSSVRLEPNPEDLRSPFICNGDKRVAVAIPTLARATVYLRDFSAPEHCNNIGYILLMQDRAQVFWSGGGICLFQGVEQRHLEVLRVVQESMSYPEEREGIGASFTDTILSLSDLYGCTGEHKRSCPVEGDRARSLIAPNGEAKTALLKKLRDFGLARDAHR